MRSDPTTFALLVDAVPSDAESRRALVHYNAAVIFANTVRSRGQRLVLCADTTTTVAVMAACAQYHQPIAVETTRDREPQGLVIFWPIDHKEPNTAEALASFDNDQPFPELWQILGEWSGATDPLSSEYRQLKFEDNPPADVFFRERPVMVSVLGRTTRLGMMLEAASIYAQEMDVPVFFDSDDDVAVFFRSETLSFQSQLDTKQLEYRWHPSIREGREPERISEELLIEIDDAQHEAKLQIVIETLVDKWGGSTQ